MPYNRISPFGVQHDLVSEGEQFRAQNERSANAHHAQKLAMQAQMDLLRGSGGGQAELFQRDPNEGRDMENVARNEMMTQQKRGMDFANQAQASELKNRLDVTGLQMGPRNQEVELAKQQWGDMAGRRGIEDEGLKNRNYMEGFKADYLRKMSGGGAQSAVPAGGLTDPGQFGPTGMMAPGGSGQQGGDQAGTERALMILGGQNPDAAAAQRDLLKLQVHGAQEESKAADQNRASAQAQGQYATIAPLVQKSLQDVRSFIRSNNWSIAGNQDQLSNLYNSVLTRLQSLRASPEALKLIEQDLKQTMRDALQENGVFFDSAGSDATRERFGL